MPFEFALLLIGCLIIVVFGVIFGICLLRLAWIYYKIRSERIREEQERLRSMRQLVEDQ